MEVHFKPDVQAKLEQMAPETGLPSESQNYTKLATSRTENGMDSSGE